MQVIKSISYAVILGMSIQSAPSNASVDYVAFDIIDLGAIQDDNTDDSLNWTPQSQVFSINSSKQVAGVSLGHQVLTLTDDETGEVTELDRFLFEPIRFDASAATPSNPVVTLENFMPDDNELGLGIVNLGIFPFSINNSGQMIGYAFDVASVDKFDVENGCELMSTTTPETRKLIFIDSELEEVSPGDDFISLTGISLNNHNYAVGYGSYVFSRDECTNVTAAVSRGFVYDRSNDSVVSIPTFEAADSEKAGSSESRAYGINDNGDIVGWAHDRDEDDNKVIRGLITNVSNLTEPTKVFGLGGIEVKLRDINNSGFAVGYSTHPSARNKISGIIYNPNTEESVDLGYLRDDLTLSDAKAINDSGDVVGVSVMSVNPNVYHGFLYSEGLNDNKIIDLNTMIDCDAGWIIAEAKDITNEGYIVGQGSVLVTGEDGSKSGEVHGFMLVPRSTPANQSCENEQASKKGGALPIHWMMLTLMVFGFRRRS